MGQTRSPEMAATTTVPIEACSPRNWSQLVPRVSGPDLLHFISFQIVEEGGSSAMLISKGSPLQNYDLI